MANITVNQLVEDTVAIDNTPISQQTFSPERIVSFLDEEMRGAIIPLFTKAREEYFVHTMNIPVDPTFKGFTIPGQAAGFRLRDIYLYDDNGNFRVKFIRINPDQIPSFGWMPSTVLQPSYYIENNKIVIFPALSQTGIMKVRWFKAPNTLGLYEQVGGRVTAKLGAGLLQLDNVPATWTSPSGLNGIRADFTEQQSPFNFLEWDDGAPIVNNELVTIDINAQQVTLGNMDVYDRVSVGDYIWQTGYCGFVQFLPYEAYQLIKYRASMRILKAQGDLQNLAVSAQLYNAAADDVLNLISPKVENQIKRVTQSASPMMVNQIRGWW